MKSLSDAQTLPVFSVKRVESFHRSNRFDHIKIQFKNLIFHVQILFGCVPSELVAPERIMIHPRPSPRRPFNILPRHPISVEL